MRQTGPERGRSGSPHDGAPSALNWRLNLARLALFWEGAVPALAPAAIVACLFAAAVLFDLLPRLPTALHWLALLAFAGGFGWAVWRARQALALPDALAGRRRLEKASGFVHRPLQTLDDKPAGAPDSAQAALWEAHRRRLMSALAKVRVGWPRPGLVLRDPMALRVGLVLLLVVGIGVGGDQAGLRFARALAPGVDTPGQAPGALDLWITPPAYTGLPPVIPRVDANEIAVPVGSQLIAQVSGGPAAPRLSVDAKQTAFAPVENSATASDGKRLQSWRASAELTEGTRLKIDQGLATMGAWTLRLVPDAPPTVEFPQAPQRTRRAALRLEYLARDDYGIAGVVAEIRRPEATGPGQPVDLALPLPGARLKEATASSFHDLSAHPWAGLPVKITLRATDLAGQTGASETLDFVMPERVFQHPVARAIVEQRKLIVQDATLRPAVARALAAIGANPLQFAEDPVVFMGLRVAAQRLIRDGAAETIDEMQGLMWDLALRIEDGRLSSAERELRAIQQRLQDALASNAPDHEIERLMQELQQAIDRYLQAMVEQALRNPDQAQRRDPNERAQRMERNDLQRLLDQARQLARTGARDAARDLLARLQEMLENLRTMQANRDGQQGGQPGDSQAQEMMRGLQELMQRQQGLIDRTFRRSQQNRPGQFRPGQQPGQQGQQGQQGQGQQGQGEDGEGEAGEQDSLRGALGDMMRQLEEMLGGVPEGFGQADRSMGDSGEQLRRGQPGRALRPQMDALDQMRRGAGEAMRQMMERFGQGPGEGEGAGDDAFGDRNNADLDPAGRDMEGNNGNLTDAFQRIPGIGEGQLQRSQEILDELIRRLGQRTRPGADTERDYLERLLRRF
jgi:uncharacterized protein (TIGR02302 family)